MSETQRHLSIWILVILALASFPPRVASADDPGALRGFPASSSSTIAPLSAEPEEDAEIPYSEFAARVDRHQISSAVIAGQSIRGVMRDGSVFSTVSPDVNQTAIVDGLVRGGARVTGESPYLSGEDLIKGLAIALNAGLPMLLLIGAWWYLNRSSRGSLGTPDLTQMRRSSAQQVAPGEVKMRLRDVAGLDEAKQEVTEIIDYLRAPAKYTQLGAKIPRGVLLVGPPGTGKTLLARAIAGEAGVPFFVNSGSAFVEIYVGVGAARVRDLFAQAKLRAPCIVFIDEIDAVGGHRAAGGSGTNDEREQTLNQLLVEMDGFSGNNGIIVIAATNRPDCLDAALLRPGRFDRRIVIPLPAVRAREEIIRVHLRSVPLAADVSPATVARATAGFSGAELANLVNEAALLAAREGAQEVAWHHVEQALDKLTLGLERRTAQPTEAERRTAAYHEAGHAIVSLNVPDHDPVRKITIIPRGRSLGATVRLPTAERSSLTRRVLESRLCALLGGRAAEELIFGPESVTTAAADDLERANELACRMVAQYGFCEALGPVCYLRAEEAETAGASVGMTRALSPNAAGAVDRAQHALIEASHARARAILAAHSDALHALANALLQSETLDASQIHAIVEQPLVSPCPRKSSRHGVPCSRSFKRSGRGSSVA
jgi:cell division protease FtsH